MLSIDPQRGTSAHSSRRVPFDREIAESLGIVIRNVAPLKTSLEARKLACNPTSQDGLESASQIGLENPCISTSHQGAFVHDDDLRQYAEHSTKAVPNTKRGQLRFPAPRRTYAKGKLDPATGKRGACQSYKKDVERYLYKWGMRTLNDLADDDFGLPTHDQLVTLFWDRVRERAKLTDPDPSQGDKPTKMRLDYLKAEALCEREARNVLDGWDPLFRQKSVERGHLGKLIARPRGRTATSEATYEQFRELEARGHTIPQMAAALGIGKRSVSTLRARYRLEQSDDLSR